MASRNSAETNVVVMPTILAFGCNVLAVCAMIWSTISWDRMLIVVLLGFIGQFFLILASMLYEEHFGKRAK